jgi:glycosyl transferase family 87
MRGERLLLIVLAAIGGVLLAVVIGVFWQHPNDNLAYWIAADRLAHDLPIYATGAAAFEPYAYHYPPPLAQALAPFTLFVPALAYVIGYRALLLLTTWDLAGRRMLWMLALIAFVPVAIELRFENVQLFMAVAVVYGLGRWPWAFAVMAVIKVSPGLGVIYLALRRRWRDAAIAAAVGVAIIAVSVALDANLWRQFFDAVSGQAGIAGNSIVPVPYVVRAVIGLVLVIAGGLIGQRTGELLLVAAVTAANPNLTVAGFAVLAAAVPIWRAGPGGIAERARREPAMP